MFNKIETTIHSRGLEARMKYTIKEFSEHLGITTDTLRLYEKHDIVKPIKDEKNNYRYFDDLDARQLLSCRWYRSLDISLKDAAWLTMHADKTQISDTLTQKKIEIENEINRLKVISAVIDQTKDAIQLTGDIPVYEVKEFPKVYRYIQTKRNTLISEKKGSSSDTQAWMETLPNVMYTFKGALTPEGEIYEYEWGMAMTEETLEKMRFTNCETLEEIPASKTLTTIVTRPYEVFFEKDAFSDIKQHAQKLGYKDKGYIWGRLIITARHENSYIELMLPIE